MFHRIEHLLNNQIVNEILNLKEEGLIDNIGVSIQNISELKFALTKDFISRIQMPFNILDYRWDEAANLIKATKKERDLSIHARSVLLQGLLCSSKKDQWKTTGIDNFEEIFKFLNEKYKEYNKTSISDLCISYAISQDWIICGGRRFDN